MNKDTIKNIEKAGILYTVLRHVSNSGMLRVIGVYYIKNNVPIHISHEVADCLGWTYDYKKGGIRVKGVGMDMGFHLIYELSAKLFKDGYKIKNSWL